MSLDTNYLKEMICGYKEAIDFTELEAASWSKTMLREIRKDCRDFYAKAVTFLKAADVGARQAGIDFWFSRNGHGAGFFDRGLGGYGNQLQEIAENFGNKDVYAGDDGKAYFA